MRSASRPVRTHTTGRGRVSFPLVGASDAGPVTAAEFKAAFAVVTDFASRCALDVLHQRISPEEGAALLDLVRNELVKLGGLLDGFVALHVEHELAGANATNESERRAALAEVEREIMSRSETLRCA